MPSPRVACLAKRRCHRHMPTALDLLRIQYGFVIWPGKRRNPRHPRHQYLRGPITMEQGDAILDRGACSLVSFGDGWKRPRRGPAASQTFLDHDPSACRYCQRTEQGRREADAGLLTPFDSAAAEEDGNA